MHERPSPSFDVERQFWSSGRQYVAGLDEVGRGCLAGPVVAAAVVLSPSACLSGLHDSKKLSSAKRESLFPRILREALAIGIGTCSPAEIDAMNILGASLEAMRRAVGALPFVPDAVLVDGNAAIRGLTCTQKLVVRGDSKCFSIAAASVVAKVLRDRRMIDLGSVLPMYGFSRHKGYPTREHYEALEANGATEHHRRSFKLVRRQPS